MKKSKVICGLGFGDEGKGSLIDFLVRHYKIPLVVRYTGGPQAGHNVVEPNGRWHCFAQFGAGTLVPEIKTFLSKQMLVKLENLDQEARVLKSKGVEKVFERLIIDTDATIITPAHKMICQMMEIGRKERRFGSCGVGVGQALYDREKGLGIVMGDVLDENALRVKLEHLIGIKLKEAEKIFKKCPSLEMKEIYDYFLDRVNPRMLAQFYSHFLKTAKINLEKEDYFFRTIKQEIEMVFEGAQGALLDSIYGFSPYITKTRATFHNAEKILRQVSKIEKIGVVRAYLTRHGPGPFVTEDINLGKKVNDSYNPENRWQGKLRSGWFDLLAIRYGVLINEGVDWIALTNLDQLSGLKTIRVCTSYDYHGDLRILEPYFKWESIGKRRAKIFAFKKPDINSVKIGELAQILFQCKPLEYKEFAGWREDLTNIRTFKKLPSQAQEYIKFLQNSGGLGVPIKIVSVNPTWEGKILLD
ncbi:MAG: adenylosuccinate synthetase [Patescibacteria group bacterium]|nr:adenylosuccinate synthetase [Patescibacteria group bacterium]MDD5164088.1 adenylosuccinate synthetase [Patescibacteria group bacterium]MDD5534254.1 adenylosuccinate synthetase [Patescibacteria group bacterium]